MWLRFLIPSLARRVASFPQPLLVSKHTTSRPYRREEGKQLWLIYWVCYCPYLLLKLIVVNCVNPYPCNSPYLRQQYWKAEKPLYLPLLLYTTKASALGTAKDWKNMISLSHEWQKFYKHLINDIRKSL